MNHYPNREQVQALRERYPPGTLIQLTADMYVTIDQRMLDYVCKEFASKFTKDDDRETIIDFNWAKEKVQKA